MCVGGGGGGGNEFLKQSYKATFILMVFQQFHSYLLHGLENIVFSLNIQCFIAAEVTKSTTDAP